MLFLAQEVSRWISAQAQKFMKGAPAHWQLAVNKTLYEGRAINEENCKSYICVKRGTTSDRKKQLDVFLADFNRLRTSTSQLVSVP